jgi:hypothetical protein
MNGRVDGRRREGSGAGGMEGFVVGSSSNWPRVPVAVCIPSLIVKGQSLGQAKKTLSANVHLMDMARSVMELLEL